MPRPSAFLLIFVLLSACNRAPTREEALTALRAGDPTLDSAPVIKRVWADGPPWFSCAEVIAKLRSGVDRAVVRNQVGNWHALVLANWISLRDTSDGPVTDPGWCRATLHDESSRLSLGWRTVLGDSTPNGQRRRGWDAPSGSRRLSIERIPRHLGGDSAEVNYLLTTAPNASGLALGADGDTVHLKAMLQKADGNWHVLRMR